MNSSQGEIGPVKANPILFKNGLYSAVSFGNLKAEDVHCQAQHQGSWLTETYINSIEKDPEINIIENVNSTEIECDPTEGNLKVNVMSINILVQKSSSYKNLKMDLTDR
ncbi:Hypothetical predicted protein [Pelobates cultripes]|uniref:Uncharacterized protein n=1 Tax=Pelobates cultripes TaxID=61616 RepID=A0AAD1S813_PELCU|nr:Hypothetical predicted protein [Pelobates cultripes]